jgi:hypothetical protein
VPQKREPRRLFAKASIKADRADPQVLRTPAEDDPIDARLTPPAGLDLHVAAGETTEWRRRRAEDTAIARATLRWTRVGAIAAIIGIILAPVQSQKDHPLSRMPSATSLPGTVPVATPTAPQAGSAAGSQGAHTAAASPQSSPRKNLVRNKAPSSHGSTGFDFVAPSPFGSDDHLGGTP